jgi:dimethylglycine dehydrogenase
VVFKNGESVGVVGSGGYGHRIGRSIALAYVRRDLAVPGTILDIGILGTMRRATVAASPLYDPGNARLRL